MRSIAVLAAGLLVSVLPDRAYASDPDLVVTGVTLRSAAREGTPIDVASTVAASATGAAYGGASSSFLYFFLSTDRTLSSDDPCLANRSIPGLQPGEASSAVTSVGLPSGVSGTRYLIVILDGSVDTSPENNRQVIELQIAPPDLVLGEAALASLLPVRQGSKIQVTNTVTADAAGAAYHVGSYSSLYVFLSTDPTLSSEDSCIAVREVPTLQPGEASTDVTTVQLPGDVYGTRYLIVILDGRIDTTPANNQQVIEVRIAPPDLVVTASVSPTAQQGSSIQVANTVTASADGAAYSGSYGSLYFFLSSDPVLSSEDVVLASRTVPPLPYGAVSSQTTSVQLPSAVFGLRYLIVILDGHSDTSPVNDVVVLPIQIVPLNLSIAGKVTPNITLRGGTIAVQTTVTCDPAGGSYSGSYGIVAIYLATDATLSSVVQVLSSYSISALQPGQSTTRTTSVQFPSGFVGAGYVIVGVDGRADYDASDNAYPIPIQVRESLAPCERIQCGDAGCVVAAMPRGTACTQSGAACGQVCDGVSPYCQPAE